MGRYHCRPLRTSSRRYSPLLAADAKRFLWSLVQRTCTRFSGSGTKPDGDWSSRYLRWGRGTW